MKLAKLTSDIHIGDTVIITEKPKTWNSGLGGLRPFDLEFPHKSIVKNINSDGTMLTASGYGWSSNGLIKDQLILVDMLKSNRIKLSF